jgi:hypothetical protein
MSRTLLTVCIAGCWLGIAMESTHTQSAAGGPFEFEPLTSSAPCVAGGVGAFPNEQPFVLPPGYVQSVLAREGDGGSTDNWDMNTLNETGPYAGRFLYRTHETLEHGQVSVTDLQTG